MREPKYCGFGSIATSGGAGGVDYLFEMWVGRGEEQEGLDEGWRGEELEKGGE